jgi:16S rRNA (uracil1498-N3)-methyltransferase
VNRFFVPAGTVAQERFALPDAISHQVLTVLRLRDGDEIVLLEGDGFATRCRLVDRALQPLERRAVTSEPRHRLTVCQALLKGDHLEQVVRHGTEIGVDRFRLIVSQRTIPRELSTRRLERLRTIARESAEQSERGAVPPVDAPRPFDAVLESSSVLLYERLEGQRLSDLEAPSSIVIGPEGGFTPDEVAGAETAGASLAGLGPRILRSESVAVAAAAVVLSRTGDFA